ncbi:DUF3800 domain-containing protein [Burkholderia sola]|uniref:DUF3800 domain-containing protein n=1 Tax=Burkholderia TaxID=32008 RepID=UPI001AE2B1A9|nr:DUF3800 domain-containing protein [Burkholderia sp. AcTa6-5]MBP0714263.1 DUF3800 domain-containing protein [Burkholderia sp. AcTa6-5]
MTFYLDESGHSGDMVNSGKAFDFQGQPYFALAAVGLKNEDESEVARHIAELRDKHRIPPGELKSKSLVSKPKFVADVIDHLFAIKSPLFVELVDKRYFISVNITSFMVLPVCMDFPEGPRMTFLRNVVADFLHAEASTEVLDAFVGACMEPSEERLLACFTLLRSLATRRILIPATSEIAQGIRVMVDDAENEYRELKKQYPEAFLKFLPPPDYNKRSKRVWMLPNLTSFANIYARINYYFRRDIQGIHIVHDQQLEVEEILQLGKQVAEAQRERDNVPHTPRSDFIFDQTATFSFAQSHDHIGLQMADIVAGAAMRCFRDSRIGQAHPDLARAVDRLIENSDSKTGFGVNQVVATRDVRYA